MLHAFTAGHSAELGWEKSVFTFCCQHDDVQGPDASFWNIKLVIKTRPFIFVWACSAAVIAGQWSAPGVMTCDQWLVTPSPRINVSSPFSPPTQLMRRCFCGWTQIMSCQQYIKCNCPHRLNQATNSTHRHFLSRLMARAARAWAWPRTVTINNNFPRMRWAQGCGMWGAKYQPCALVINWKLLVNNSISCEKLREPNISSHQNRLVPLKHNWPL